MAKRVDTDARLDRNAAKYDRYVAAKQAADAARDDWYADTEDAVAHGVTMAAIARRTGVSETGVRWGMKRRTKH